MALLALRVLSGPVPSPTASRLDPPESPTTAPVSATVKIKATVPRTLDAWLRTQASALGIDKSSFVRMLLMEKRREVENAEG